MKVILGSTGFIGSALAKRLPGARHLETSSQYSRLDQDCSWLGIELELAAPDTVYLCAGRTGGVGRMASDPLSFIYPNVRIHMNVFQACVKARVKRVVCVGSTTGYPDTGDPVRESQYLEGNLHPAYEVPGNAHRFIKRLANMHKELEILFFRPSNVYGPGNNFDPLTSHVIEATVRKVHERQDPFVIWGTGNEVRDAIFIDDLVEAMALADDFPPGDYNVGTGTEMSVNQMVDVLLGHTHFYPQIEHDTSKPTAIPARRVDVSKLHSLGWEAKVSMEEGLKRTYNWYAAKGAV